MPPQQPYYGYQQPYYQQPYSQPMVTTKDHVAAGLLAIFLGAFGIHKFYLGYNTAGFIMLAVTIIGGVLTFSLASWVIWVIAIIEGILYLTKSQTEFEQIYVLNKREWF
ncbi:MAG: TM2 domain-containing protein [Eggerthellaceae bacterium]